MLGWLTRLLSGRNAGGRRRVRATRDIVQDTTENSRHWEGADQLSARNANSYEVRKTARSRARHEAENNSYARGIILTLANNLVGSGPRLQVQLPDQSAARQIEQAWQKWAKAVQLAGKLRTMTAVKKTDGEAFCLLGNNPMLADPVKLDLRLIEADQVSTPNVFNYAFDPLATDGIKFDTFGNPVEYHLLKQHPGDWAFGVNPLDYDIVPASLVIHWFRQDRPGEVRGFPEIGPALPLFSFLRRFTLATVSAAEIAAMFAALLKSNAPAETSELAVPFSTTEIERGMMTMLPDGVEMQQLKAEHPSTTYEIFVWCLLREICRCLNIPLNIALGDSSKSNFASARLDHLVYRQSVEVEREDCECDVVARLTAAWYAEAVLIPGHLPAGLPRSFDAIPHLWAWPAWAPIDEVSDARAKKIRRESGLANVADICGEESKDWREHIRQGIVEDQYAAQVRAELGVPEPTLPMGVTNANAA